jgi:hypothetical protein
VARKIKEVEDMIVKDKDFDKVFPLLSSERVIREIFVKMSRNISTGIRRFDELSPIVDRTHDT